MCASPSCFSEEIWFRASCLYRYKNNGAHYAAQKHSGKLICKSLQIYPLDSRTHEHLHDIVHRDPANGGAVGTIHECGDFVLLQE